MIIVITGTPGTGKSEISLQLGKIFKFAVIDVKESVKKNRMFAKKKDKELLIDLKLLKRLLIGQIKNEKNAIIDSHLLCDIDLPADIVVVLRTDIKELEKRLNKRGYTKKKVYDNLMCEMLDYCLMKSELNYTCRILQANTTGKNALQNARRIALAIKHKKKSLDNVDHSRILLKSLVS